jgi:hypothetical protein
MGKLCATPESRRINIQNLVSRPGDSPMQQRLRTWRNRSVQTVPDRLDHPFETSNAGLDIAGAPTQCPDQTRMNQHQIPSTLPQRSITMNPAERIS